MDIPYIALEVSSSKIAAALLTEEELGRVMKNLILKYSDERSEEDTLQDKERLLFDSLDRYAANRKVKYERQVRHLKQGGIDEHIANSRKYEKGAESLGVNEEDKYDKYK